MELIADILLAAGALGAGIYCMVLGRRLNRFNSLEKGIGGAVAVLSSQVDDLKKALDDAQATAAVSAETLTQLNKRAEDMSHRLELQLAAMSDIPELPRTDNDRQAQGAGGFDTDTAPGPDAKQTARQAPGAFEDDVDPLVEALSRMPQEPREPMFLRHSQGRA